ncbi:MAG: hypothetical protein DMF89_15915 [Acidobacteria bacterium]|nr:MAG: hypothetical protein DMF90_24110 [Acidobacteriota bacterium]PYR48376.1 MAG: hypothetical protein DMF89_15915 [Acidobacteriota bacterium]
MPIQAFAGAVLFTIAVACGAHAAQSQSGQPITGTVVDPTGAVLPAAHVELLAATGTPIDSTTADAAGVFRFDRVAPGRYDMRITFEGFRPTTVRVTVGSRPSAPLRVTLPLAAISQEVTVGNTPAEVKPDSASNLDASSVDAQGH